MVIIEMRVNDPADTEFHIFLYQAREGLKSKNSDVAALFLFFPESKLFAEIKKKLVAPCRLICVQPSWRERESELKTTTLLCRLAPHREYKGRLCNVRENATTHA
jgi:hypothetical protein